MNWDWIITVFILLTLALAIWARVSRQTIPELIGDLRDRLSDTKEDIEDNFGSTYSYYS